MQDCRNARKQGFKNEVKQESSVTRWSTLFKRECRDLGLIPPHNTGCYILLFLAVICCYSWLLYVVILGCYMLLFLAVICCYSWLLYRVAAINPEQLQSFAGALKVVFLY
jgi:hypothetical protein